MPAWGGLHVLIVYCPIALFLDAPRKTRELFPSFLLMRLAGFEFSECF